MASAAAELARSGPDWVEAASSVVTAVFAGCAYKLAQSELEGRRHERAAARAEDARIEAHLAVMDALSSAWLALDAVGEAGEAQLVPRGVTAALREASDKLRRATALARATQQGDLVKFLHDVIDFTLDVYERCVPAAPQGYIAGKKASRRIGSKSLSALHERQLELHAYCDALFHGEET